MKQADRVVRGVIRTERIRADEFGEAVGAVCVRGAVWPHLVQNNIDACIGDLPCGFRTGETAADDVHDAGLICV